MRNSGIITQNKKRFGFVDLTQRLLAIVVCLTLLGSLALGVRPTAAFGNTAPTITSANTATLPENGTFAMVVISTDDIDSQGDGLTYSKTGGADQALLNIDPTWGDSDIHHCSRL